MNFLLLLLTLAHADEPTPLKMRGRAIDDGVAFNGRVLFEGDAITLRKRTLFKTRTVSYDYSAIRKLVTERGLFGGDLLFAMTDGEAVTLHVRGSGKAKAAEAIVRSRLRGP